MKRKCITIGVLVALALTSQAAVITQSTGGNWSSTGTWVGGVSPQTGDSVVLTGGNMWLDTTFTLQSGQFVTNSVDTTLRFKNGTFTAESGSTLDVQTIAQDGGGIANIVINDGATFNVGQHGFLAPNQTWQFNASETGVSTVTLANNLFTDNGGTAALVVDLTGYNVANGSTLTLFDAGSISGAGFSSFTVLGAGYSADLTLDTVNGDVKLTNVIPEPATLGLICGSGVLVLFIRRIFII